MKIRTLLLTGMAALMVSGCITYERRETPVVVSDSDRYIATLPIGYSTTIYRGNTYYVSGERYYRSTPRGYMVVTRPY